jgi:hypothetical protein
MNPGSPNIRDVPPYEMSHLQGMDGSPTKQTTRRLHLQEIRMREPSSIQHPRVPHGCDQQGRHPQAAECCTELGQEEEPDFYGLEYWKEECISMIILAVALVAIAGTLVALYAT